jgi:site-specific recombinase XerD
LRKSAKSDIPGVVGSRKNFRSKHKELCLRGEKSYAMIIGKGNKVRTLYILPKAAAYLEKYRNVFHGELPDPNRYVFFSRNHDGM